MSQCSCYVPVQYTRYHNECFAIPDTSPALVYLYCSHRSTSS